MAGVNGFGESQTFGATLGAGAADDATGFGAVSVFASVDALAFLVAGFFLVVVFLVVFFFCAMPNTLVKRCRVVGEPGAPTSPWPPVAFLPLVYGRFVRGQDD